MRMSRNNDPNTGIQAQILTHTHTHIHTAHTTIDKLFLYNQI